MFESFSEFLAKRYPMPYKRNRASHFRHEFGGITRQGLDKWLKKGYVVYQSEWVCRPLTNKELSRLKQPVADALYDSNTQIRYRKVRQLT